VRNILQSIKSRKDNRIGHILRRNCLLKHIIEGKIEGRLGETEDNEQDVSSYWKDLRKREGAGSTRLLSLENSLSRGCGPVTRENTE
jgi:hypothetical protein